MFLVTKMNDPSAGYAFKKVKAKDLMQLLSKDPSINIVCFNMCNIEDRSSNCRIRIENIKRLRLGEQYSGVAIACEDDLRKFARLFR
jgi:hypothetical protein